MNLPENDELNGRGNLSDVERKVIWIMYTHTKTTAALTDNKRATEIALLVLFCT